MTSAENVAQKLWLPTVVVLVAYVVATYFFTDVLVQLGINPGPIPIAAPLLLLGAGYFIFARRNGWSFFMVSMSILFAAGTIFLILFPRVLVSSIDPANSLTIYNSASGPYTLQTMSIIALIFLPVVLGYEAWSYWVFRKRISSKVEELHY
jgi:cytochrome bd ubiquinol oxidase subunit II